MSEICLEQIPGSLLFTWMTASVLLELGRGRWCNNTNIMRNVTFSAFGILFRSSSVNMVINDLVSAINHYYRNCFKKLLEIAQSHSGVLRAAIFGDDWNHIGGWGCRVVYAYDVHRSSIFQNCCVFIPSWYPPTAVVWIYTISERKNVHGRRGIWLVAAISCSGGMPLTQLKLQRIVFIAFML